MKKKSPKLLKVWSGIFSGNTPTTRYEAWRLDGWLYVHSQPDGGESCWEEIDPASVDVCHIDDHYMDHDTDSETLEDREIRDRLDEARAKNEGYIGLVNPFGK